MKTIFPAALALAAWLGAMPSASAASSLFEHIVSPDREQAFAYGLERDRVWTQWRRHLALLLDFLGVDEVHLLPNVNLVVDRPHGYITVYLDVLDDGPVADE